MLFKLITVVILCIPTCLSQINGKECSAYNVNVVQDFSPKQYSGKWYEYERYEAFFQMNTGCVTATYTLNDRGNITVVNRAKNLLFNTKTSITGEAFPADPTSSEAKLKVSFFAFLPPGDYWVIGTDYEKYSVVWACQNKRQFLWVLVRKLDMIEEIEPTVNDIMDKAGLDRSQLMKTKTDSKTCGTF